VSIETGVILKSPPELGDIKGHSQKELFLLKTWQGGEPMLTVAWQDQQEIFFFFERLSVKPCVIIMLWHEK
jgi:hypothetical protein